MSDDKRQSTKETMRLFLLDALFQNGDFYTAEQLREKLSVSPATLNRAIKSLREQYNAPLICEKRTAYDGEITVYRYSTTLFKLPAVFATEEEMPAYSMVLQLFEMFRETPLYFPLINILETFETPIESDSWIGPEIQSSEVRFRSKKLPDNAWFKTRIVMAQRPAVKIDESQWEIILKALKNNQQLKFDYETITENRKSYSRILEPWQLIYDREQWFLTGMATEADNNAEKKVRTFAVQRMTNIELLSTHFKLPAENQWMLSKYGIGSLGATTTGTIKKYKFIFQGSALFWSNEVFGAEQKVEPYSGNLPHDKNAVSVTFKSNKEPAILKEFFAYGSDIVPVEPEDFVMKWKDKVQKMTEYL